LTERSHGFPLQRASGTSMSFRCHHWNDFLLSCLHGFQSLYLEHLVPYWLSTPAMDFVLWTSQKHISFTVFNDRAVFSLWHELTSSLILCPRLEYKKAPSVRSWTWISSKGFMEYNWFRRIFCIPWALFWDPSDNFQKVFDIHLAPRNHLYTANFRLHYPWSF
jgi:hypothetical protein